MIIDSVTHINVHSIKTLDRVMDWVFIYLELLL
jgi:hypothetical protein